MKKFFKMVFWNFVLIGAYSVVYMFPEYSWVVRYFYYIVYPISILCLILIYLYPSTFFEKDKELLLLLTKKKNIVHRVVNRFFDVIHIGFFIFFDWRAILVLFVFAEILMVWAKNTAIKYGENNV